MFWGYDPLKHQTLDEENTKVEELGNALGSLNGRKKLYCSDACLRRYLRARNWNVGKAKSMLEETLKWRDSCKPEDIRWEEVAVEHETGKMYRGSFTDKLGRPVIIMIPRNQNTSSHDGQLQHLIYTMEDATFHLPPGQERLLLIIDFEGWSLSKSPPIRTVRDTAHILQNHYPERLAVAIMLNAPKLFEYSWKLWKPFIDPTTYQKARFVYTSDSSSLNVIEDLFEEENLQLNLKGQYNHRDYGKMMQADDLKRKAFWEQADAYSEPINGVMSEIKEVGNGGT